MKHKIKSTVCVCANIRLLLPALHIDFICFKLIYSYQYTQKQQQQKRMYKQGCGQYTAVACVVIDIQSFDLNQQ